MLIIHYHLFKNAGTSVDAMLKANFGKDWVEREFEAGNPATNQAMVTKFLREHPDISVLSSHTALLPAPDCGRPVFPIVFVRHPLLRLASAYRFEVKQEADTFGAKLAKQADFRGYIETLLQQKEPGQARNFQTARLAQNYPDSGDTRLNKALRAVGELPFVGLVESYDWSVQRLAKMLRPHFPDFRPLVVEKNVSGGAVHDVDGRLSEIRDDLGDALFERLIEANRDDLSVFEAVRQEYRQAA